jgi:hypothetical protein
MANTPTSGTPGRKVQSGQQRGRPHSGDRKKRNQDVTDLSEDEQESSEQGMQQDSSASDIERTRRASQDSRVRGETGEDEDMPGDSGSVEDPGRH